MALATDVMLDEITRVIVNLIDPEQVILFGSYASGAARDDSDIDLLIVDGGTFDERRSRRAVKGRIWRELARFPVPKDILLYTPEEIAMWRESRNHVIAHALREGRIVYDRH
jgi:predicted nucleotidyltransferase